MNFSASPRLGGNCFTACKKYGVAPTRFLLTVSVAGQTISLFEKFSGSWHPGGKMRCSTSRFGIGQTEGSNGTPLGLHRIVEKIGGGWPGGTVFKGRRPIGYTWQGMPDAKSPRAFCGWKGSNPGSIAAATWIRMRVTFTSMAPPIRRASANPLPAGAFTWPTLI